MRITHRDLIAAEPERVWDVLADWRRYASWMPDVDSVACDRDVLHAGARLRVRTKVFNLPLVTDEVRISAWEPPSRVAIEHLGVVRGWGEWRLVRVLRGTGFVWTEELRMPPPIVGELLLRAYAPLQRAFMRRAMANLRELVARPRR